jgi:hypothetical protein
VWRRKAESSWLSAKSAECPVFPQNLFFSINIASQPQIDRVLRTTAALKEHRNPPAQ